MKREKHMLGDLTKFSNKQLEDLKDYFYSLVQMNKDKDIAAIVINNDYALLQITMAYLEILNEWQKRYDVIVK